MPISVVLGVSLDAWLLATHEAVWRSAGFIVIPVGSIREAIDHFQAGDFDLVLLGDSISNDIKERMTFLIRASGSKTPVVSIADVSGTDDWFADMTLRNDSSALLKGMGELLAEKAAMSRTHVPTGRTAS
jgi:hypothetical protein